MPASGISQLELQPDEKWKYRNSGYVLLGYLIEKISGQSYRQFVQKNILNALSMKDSGYDSNSTTIPRRASGYTRDAKGSINAGYIDMSVPFSAGARNSTTVDLLLWEQGLMGGELLSPSSLQKMTTPFKDDYVSGLGVRTVNGRQMSEHGGGIEGFSTDLAYYPDDKLTVIVLGNVDGNAPGKSRRI